MSAGIADVKLLTSRELAQQHAVEQPCRRPLQCGLVNGQPTMVVNRRDVHKAATWLADNFLYDLFVREQELCIPTGITEVFLFIFRDLAHQHAVEQPCRRPCQCGLVDGQPTMVVR